MSFGKEYPGVSELSQRTSDFDRHLQFVDWRTLKTFSQMYSSDWNRFLFYVIGLKPSLVLDGVGEVEYVKELLPKQLEKDTVITDNGWVASQSQIVKIINSNPDVFTDFNKRNSSNRDIQQYLQKRSFSMYASSVEIIKTGLLLGYPLESVIAFANHESGLSTFDFRDYRFASTQKDIDTFGGDLIKLYNDSQVEKVENAYTNVVKEKFIESLSTQGDIIDLIKINDLHFLEVVSPDVENSILIKQLLLLKGTATEKSIHGLVNEFGSRYHIEALRRSGPFLVGIGHDKTVQEILLNNTKEKVPYLSFYETWKEYKYSTGMVEKDALINWLPQRIQVSVAKLIR